MADAALARREARRKRILENSHNRLQLISNITSDDCCKESPVGVRTSTPEQNNEIPVTKIENTTIRGTIFNGMTNIEPVSYDSLSDNVQEVVFREQEVTNDSTAFAFPKAEPPVVSIFKKFITCKYDLVLLSLLMQLIHSFSIMTVENTYFFLPLILYTITKAIFFPKQEKSKYANILLLLNCINSQQAHKLMSVLHWGSILLQDVCIYLFTTICFQSLYIFIIDMLF